MAKRIVWSDQAKADVCGIEQAIALQILKTLARYAQTGEGKTKQLRDTEPPMIRLRAQDHRVFFRDKGDYLVISRVLDRKEAYRSGALASGMQHPQPEASHPFSRCEASSFSSGLDTAR